MTTTDYSTLLLRSFRFWNRESVRIPELRKHFWLKRDYAKFKQVFEVCPICHAEPMFDTGDQAGTIYCFCATLEILAINEPQEYESRRKMNYLFSDIKPYDIPKGAARITKGAIITAEQFTRNADFWGFLNGGTGNAKTHILNALRNYLGGFAHYVTVSDFHQMLIIATRGDYADELISTLQYAPILLLDDFGMEHTSKTEYTLNILTHIIDQRYILGKDAPVWITTNLTADEMLNSPSDNMRRAASRLLDSEIVKVWSLTQADYRLPTFKEEAGI